MATSYPNMRPFIDNRQALQQERIRWALRLDAIERGVDEHPGAAIMTMYQSWHNEYLEKEREADNEIRAMAQDIAIIELMVSVKGVAFITAAKVIGYIDIERAPTVSALWRYAGFAVFDGKRERLKKGERAHFNTKLKTACMLVASSMMRSRSPYTDLYYSQKEKYEADPVWKDRVKAWIDLAARRRMIKMWLSHVWEVWRSTEGLPTRPPYAIEYLKHKHYKSPIDYGWAIVPNNPVLDPSHALYMGQKGEQ